MKILYDWGLWKENVHKETSHIAGEHRSVVDTEGEFIPRARIEDENYDIQESSDEEESNSDEEDSTSEEESSSEDEESSSESESSNFEWLSY